MESCIDKIPAVLTIPTGPHSTEVQQANRKVTQEVLIQDSAITNLSVELEIAEPNRSACSLSPFRQFTRQTVPRRNVLRVVVSISFRVGRAQL